MDSAIALFNIFLFLSYLCLVFCCLYYDEINIYITGSVGFLEVFLYYNLKLIILYRLYFFLILHRLRYLRTYLRTLFFLNTSRPTALSYQLHFMIFGS